MKNSEHKAVAMERIKKLQVEIEENTANGVTSVDLWDEFDMLRDIIRELGADNERTTVG